MSGIFLSPEYSDDDENQGEIQDEFSEKVEHIKGIIPLVSRLVIREELEMHDGNVKKTIKQLKRLRPISALTKEFPKLDIEVITHVLQKNGWDEGTSRGELKLILEKYKTIKRKKAAAKSGGGSAPPPAPATAPPPDIISPRQAAPLPPPEPEDEQSACRALFDYDTGHPAKLTFRKGNVILLTDDSGDSWWHGQTKSGAKGKFPKSYVRRLEDDIPAEVLYDFNISGEQPGRLQSSKGEKIYLLNKRKGSQWWEAVTHEGLVGMIPSTYFTVTENVALFESLDKA